jgi:NAD(P)-dependent dehydrogenase (short-subunit alcohol dehydrogenase family)
MQTVMITGASSGFGLDAARHFLAQGWRVVAAMRKPDAAPFPASDRLMVVALDVTDAQSIAQAVQAAGPVDVLVNNAGIGWLNAVEATPPAAARNIFETNTLGTIAVTQALLPQMRLRRAGTIINVTSSVTLLPLPLLAVYTASKAAVNAFTEVLALELAPFGIRTHVVLPGRAPDTRFGANAQALMANSPFPEPYMPQVQAVLQDFATPTDHITTAADVTAAIWQAATDPNAPARIPAGRDAAALFKG